MRSKYYSSTPIVLVQSKVSIEPPLYRPSTCRLCGSSSDPKRAAIAPRCRACSASRENRVGSLLIGSKQSLTSTTVTGVYTSCPARPRRSPTTLPTFLRRFFVGIHPTYPLFRGLKIWRRFSPGMLCYPPLPEIFRWVSPTEISAKVVTRLQYVTPRRRFTTNTGNMLDLGKTQRVNSQHCVGATLAPTVTQ